MADGFEPYHVPQQSRRDKLRVVVQTDPPGCAGLLPLYDPSVFPSDLLSCANLHHHHQNNHNPLLDEPTKQDPTHNSTVKREGVNLMGYVGSSSSTSQQQQHIYMDPQSSLHINPSSIHDISNNPFLFTPQNLRVYDQSFNGDEVVVYKPEPLSLSLSSHQTHQSTLPLELNLQRYESSIFTDKVSSGVFVVPSIVGGGGSGGSAANDLSRSSVPLGPFTGYGSILKGSRFLKPAQQLLEEICDVGLGIYAEKITEDSGLMDAPVENLGGSGVVEESVSGGDGGGEQRKKSRLISMLNEVYRRYKYYYQQMQAVVASFESVAGLSNAAPYANLALEAMSKHFRSLKNAITDQLQFTKKDQNDPKDETPRLGIPDALYSQRLVHNSGFLENQPVWRPQRGLPERAVNVLRAWLFEHFLHPYPTDTDKIMLAKQTGLSRSQVSNWFINARVRLWKPMVEEIHMLETRQTQKSMQRDDQNADRPSDPSDHLPPGTSLASEHPSTSTKRTKNNFPNTSMGTEEPMSLSYENLSRHHGGGGVSLTLGLHQNNGIGLSEPTFPINAARRFGLDPNSEGYVMGGSFEAQNRQFGRDVIGGQFLHDFVG